MAGVLVDPADSGAHGISIQMYNGEEIVIPGQILEFCGKNVAVRRRKQPGFHGAFLRQIQAHRAEVCRILRLQAGGERKEGTTAQRLLFLQLPR